MKNQKGLAHIAVVVVIVAISLSMIGVIYYFKSEYNKSATTIPPTTNTTTITNAVVNTNTAVDDITRLSNIGWVKYSSEELRFSFLRPAEWKLITEDINDNFFKLVVGLQEESESQSNINTATIWINNFTPITENYFAKWTVKKTENKGFETIETDYKDEDEYIKQFGSIYPLTVLAEEIQDVENRFSIIFSTQNIYHEKWYFTVDDILSTFQFTN